MEGPARQHDCGGACGHVPVAVVQLLSGVQQGSVEGPLFYNLLMQEALHGPTLGGGAASGGVAGDGDGGGEGSGSGSGGSSSDSDGSDEGEGTGGGGGGARTLPTLYEQLEKLGVTVEYKLRGSGFENLRSVTSGAAGNSRLSLAVLQFIDDTALIARDPVALAKGTALLVERLRAFGVTINVAKSKLLNFNGTSALPCCARGCTKRGAAGVPVAHQGEGEQVMCSACDRAFDLGCAGLPRPLAW